MLKTLSITYTELGDLELDDVMDLYTRCKDDIVLDRCFLLSVNGIDYNDKEKAGSFYKDYLDDMENRDQQLSFRLELLEKFKVQYTEKKIKPIEPLINKKKK